MRIINIITIVEEVVDSIDSFPIVDDQLSQEVVDQANTLFEKKAMELGWDEDDDNHMDFFLEQGYYTNNYGHSVCFVWSNIDI
jgi:hypothetical protein